MNKDHISYDALKAELLEASEEIQIGAEYVHYKDPKKIYRVVGFVVLEAEDVVAVRYAPLAEPSVEFARPCSEWSEEVVWNSQLVPRFERID